MDPLFFILIAMLTASIVLGPVFGADSRPAFLRPDRKARSMLGPMRPADWDKQGWDH